jgi:ankyrin repeat protein
MARDTDRRREHEAFQRIDAAFRTGDFEGLRAALGSPAGFPDVSGPMTIGHCLEYAIYHSPLSFIRVLLERGADPNYGDHTGFPSLIAALACVRSAPGSPARADAHEILELLLAAGADPNQRGVNDYTPLHWAAGEGDERALRLLLAHGADATARTRIDDCETPREVAASAGHREIADLLARHEAGHAP